MISYILCKLNSIIFSWALLRHSVIFLQKFMAFKKKTKNHFGFFAPKSAIYPWIIGKLSSLGIAYVKLSRKILSLLLLGFNLHTSANVSDINSHSIIFSIENVHSYSYQSIWTDNIFHGSFRQCISQRQADTLLSMSIRTITILYE